MYGGVYYGQITYGGQPVYAAGASVTDDLTNSATNTPSILVNYEEDYLVHSGENIPSVYPDDVLAGEENIIVCENVATITIEDYDIAYTDFFYNQGTSTQDMINERISESPRQSQVNSQTLEAQDDVLSVSQVNTPSIDDIVNGNVTETVDAPGRVEPEDFSGYPQSGIAIHTLVEEDLIDIEVDEMKPQPIFIYFYGNIVYVIWNEELDPLSVPPTSAFSVDVNNAPRTVTGVEIHQNQLWITFSGSATVSTSQVEIRYTVDGTYPIRDLAGNNADPFSNYTEDEVEDPETGDPYPFPHPTWGGTGGVDIPAPTDPHGGRIVRSYGAAGISLLDVSFRVYSFHRKTGIA